MPPTTMRPSLVACDFVSWAKALPDMTNTQTDITRRCRVRITRPPLFRWSTGSSPCSGTAESARNSRAQLRQPEGNNGAAGRNRQELSAASHVGHRRRERGNLDIHLGQLLPGPCVDRIEVPSD